MKTILQEKGTLHCSITIWYTNLFLCSKPWKFLQRKQRWTRNGKNWRKFRRGTWQKSEAQKRWSMKQGRRAQKFILPHWWTSVIWRMPNWRQSTKNTKVELSPRWYCQRRFGVLKSIHQARIISISNDSSKSHGYHLQIARLRWTSSWCSICLYPDKNGRCSKIIENSKIGMSRHMDSSTTTQMAKIVVQYGRPSRSSWTKSVRSSFGRTVMGKAIWENPIEIRLGEGFQLGMLIRTQRKRIILICVCGWHQIGWEETKHWSDVVNTKQRSRVGRSNIFPWSCLPGMHSKTMWNKQRYSRQLQNHGWIQNFRRSNGKSPCSENLSVSSWSYDMEGHAKKCVERYCELANKTTQQLYKVSTACLDDNHFKEEERKISGRIVKSVLSNYSEMLIHGTYWKTRYSVISE